MSKTSVTKDDPGTTPDPTDTPDPKAERHRARRRSTGLVVTLCLLVAIGALAAGVYGLTRPIASRQVQLPTEAVVEFHSPDGLTGCRLSRDGARCDVKERTWAAPEPPAECPEKWGNAVQLTGADPGPGFVCQEEILGDVGVELPYGQRLTRGDFQCTSRESSVRCFNTQTQHGFSISRDDYTPF